jgi:hypothetical protein
MNADVQAFRGRLAARRQDVLSRQAQAQEREETDLVAISAQLNTELDQPLIDRDETPRLATSGAEPSSPSTAELGPPAASGASAAAQRKRLVEQILQETRRRAMLAASQLNLTVREWNAANPDKRAMSKLLRKMQQNDFG